MSRNSASQSRNLLWSLLILQPKCLALFFSETFHLSIILASLAVGQSPIVTFLIPVSSCTQSPLFPASGQSPAASSYAVSPFRLFWYFGLFSLPILTELLVSWMSCKGRRPGSEQSKMVYWREKQSEGQWGLLQKIAKVLQRRVCCCLISCYGH